MLGIEKKVQRVRQILVDKFTDRATHYFTLGSKSDGATKSNFNLMGALLKEIAVVLSEVTLSNDDE